MTCLVALLVVATPLDVQENAQRILANERYQAELPSAAPADPTMGLGSASGGSGPGAAPFGGPAGSAGGGSLEGREQPSGPEVPPPADEARAPDSAPVTEGPEVPSEIGAMANTTLWLLVVVVIVLLVVGAVRAFGTYQRDVAPEAPAKPPRAGTGRSRHADRPDWEGAASRGCYSEAIHLLLLDVLSRLPRGATPSIASSWTSREILSRAKLAADARDALARLVRVSEQSHFGGEPADRSLFERCRDDHRRLLMVT